jgi:large subunit ribosomal protein L9
MQVILLKELHGRGGEGDVINVARGFANNYLLPQKIAVAATKGNLRQLEERKANIAKREEGRIENANELSERLANLKVHIVAQVGEEGQLFGSVTSAMIADAIKEEHGIEVDKRRVELGKPIKRVGEYTVPVNIYRTITANVAVAVAGEETEEEDKPETEASASKEETPEETPQVENAADGSAPEAAQATSSEAPAAE